MVGLRMDPFDLAGWLATLVAFVGVWLNNKRRRACFVMWLVSNAATFALHAAASMWPMAARDAIFFLMAIHGWRLWAAKPVAG
ncbi:MAG TPA: nicotinamide mononucleotide transporter [Phycisphaerae bacterium]|nr:nicotinamide mononucleotide transporter [Phycisphaerae bacterium]